MTTIKHTIADNISQGNHDAQRGGIPVALSANLGYFDEVGQYLLAINALKDAAMVITHSPDSPQAEEELEWLADGHGSLLPASRCFDVLSGLLKIDDERHFQLAFVDAIKRDPEAVYKAMRSLQQSVEEGRNSESPRDRTTPATKASSWAWSVPDLRLWAFELAKASARSDVPAALEAPAEHAEYQRERAR